MEVIIRPYNKADKEYCLIAFKSNVPMYFTEEEITDFENFLDRLEMGTEDADSCNTYFYVVVLNGNVIGCGGFGDRYKDSIISLAWGLIHKDFHKRGLGEQLLLHRLEQIKKNYPSSPVVIDTTQFSFSFFEKYGFVTTKITLDYYTEGMHRYDMSLNNSSG
jgi:ribosomal-protein-alanine N-acetyltransferase